MKRIPLCGLFVLAGLLAAPIARAQMVPMSRCHAAFPCSIPYSIQYRPDPLIAGPYGGVGSGGMLVTIPLQVPLEPRIEKSKAPDVGQALDADINRALSHAPAKPTDGDEAGVSPAPSPPPVPPRIDAPPKPESSRSERDK